VQQHGLQTRVRVSGGAIDTHTELGQQGAKVGDGAVSFRPHHQQHGALDLVVDQPAELSANRRARIVGGYHHRDVARA